MALAPDSWPAPFRGLIRTSNKYLVNPVMLRLAGKPYWYASVVHHTGRRSGKEFSTPVVVEKVGDQLLIPLPYGTDVDWVRNVRAGGGATLVHKGQTLAVEAPEIIDAAVALPSLPSDRRRTFDRAGITHYLRVQISE